MNRMMRRRHNILSTRAQLWLTLQADGFFGVLNLEITPRPKPSLTRRAAPGARAGDGRCCSIKRGYTRFQVNLASDLDDLEVISQSC